MKALPAVALLLAGCVTGSAPPAQPNTIAGSWQQGGLTLSISSFSTFAVQRGCVATGGVLQPLGGGRYRIERYETGFATDECGPWRSGPDIAPFDGPEVTLVVRGDQLVASGGGRRVELRRLSAPIV